MSEEKEKPKFDPRTELNADLWGTMSLHDLYEQEILLQNRIDFALRVGNAPMQEQLQRGMAGLQALIKFRNKGEDELKVTVVDPYATVIDRTQK